MIPCRPDILACLPIFFGVVMQDITMLLEVMYHRQGRLAVGLCLCVDVS